MHHFRLGRKHFQQNSWYWSSSIGESGHKGISWHNFTFTAFRVAISSPIEVLPNIKHGFNFCYIPKTLFRIWVEHKVSNIRNAMEVLSLMWCKKFEFPSSSYNVGSSKIFLELTQLWRHQALTPISTHLIPLLLIVQLSSKLQWKARICGILD